LQDADNCNQITLREAKRQNATYRSHAVAALSQVALARTDVDMNANVFDIVKPLLESSVDNNEMEVDDEQPRAVADA
jgi:proteasome component ECM29